MADLHPTQLDELLKWARKYASAEFAKHPQSEELIADTQRVAWELQLQAGERGNPRSCAMFAVKRVRSNRHFDQSVRSIDTPLAREDKHVRAEFDASLIFSNQTPARIAGFRLDFHDWLDSLSPRQRMVAELLAVGNTTEEVAQLLGCTPGNVSQYRLRLRNSWYAFTA